ncbi:MAG: AAA family ATPase [Acidaminobacteraceae bacterium]
MKNKNYSGYNSYDEYLNDISNLIDLYLIGVFLEEEKLAELNNSRHKGIAITQDEVLSSLGIRNQESDLIKIKYVIEAKEKHSIINKKIGATKEEISKEFYLNNIFEHFNLKYLEILIILFALSPYLNERYYKVYGYLNDNMMKKLPTFGIVIKSLGKSYCEAYKFISSEGNLKKYLLEDDLNSRAQHIYDREIILSEKVADYIFNVEKVSLDISHASEMFYYKSMINDDIGSGLTKDIVRKSISNHYSEYKSNESLYIRIIGDLGSGRRHLCRHVAKRINRNILFVDFAGFDKNNDFVKILNSIIREAILSEAMIGIVNYQLIHKENLMINSGIDQFFAAFSNYSEPVFMIEDNSIKKGLSKIESSITKHYIDRPSFDDSIKIWNYYLEKFLIESVDAIELATKFKITPSQIENSIKEFRVRNIIQEDLDYSIYRAVYDQIENSLSEKASKIKPVYGWDDIVIPDETLDVLNAICNQVKFRNTVMNEWGFGEKIPYGKGISLICAGPPGTGKTMSAQILAKELNLEMYKVDLSKVISKYIGETEKNLNSIFEEAKYSNAILFFDESDALFGKRTGVKDSKDRYSNMEISFLLQKIEEYEGITILATNFLNNIDKAFLRRISYIVNFPFPTASNRLKIWTKTFSKGAPLSSSLDYEFLANNFELSGGNIKNVVLNSAYIAAALGSEIDMRSVIKAIKAEMQKIDKLLLKEELREYSYLLD